MRKHRKLHKDLVRRLFDGKEIGYIMSHLSAQADQFYKNKEIEKHDEEDQELVIRITNPIETIDEELIQEVTDPKPKESSSSSGGNIEESFTEFIEDKPIDEPEPQQEEEKPGNEEEPLERHPSDEPLGNGNEDNGDNDNEESSEESNSEESEE